jgi:putative ATPase
VNVIGYPEAAIILSQTVVYLACSPKSNSSYKAIKEVQQFIRQKGKLPVPLHLRNATTQLMKQNNYGKNYQYAHDFEGHFVVQEYLPAELSGTKFYEPANNAREQELRTYLKKNWKNKYGY